MADTALYVLMRTDLASLNPGKACAQATHAANQMVHHIRVDRDSEMLDLLDVWENQTGHGFGTCFVLAVKEAEMRWAVERCRDHFPQLAAGIVHDPTYPLRDGETTHFIPLDTCAYVFGERDVAALVVGDFPLLP